MCVHVLRVCMGTCFGVCVFIHVNWYVRIGAYESVLCLYSAVYMNASLWMCASFIVVLTIWVILCSIVCQCYSVILSLCDLISVWLLYIVNVSVSECVSDCDKFRQCDCITEWLYYSLEIGHCVSLTACDLMIVRHSNWLYVSVIVVSYNVTMHVRERDWVNWWLCECVTLCASQSASVTLSFCMMALVLFLTLWDFYNRPLIECQSFDFAIIWECEADRTAMCAYDCETV